MVDRPTSFEPEGLFHGLQQRSIAFGFVVDTVLSLIAFALLFVWFAGPDLFGDNEAMALEAEIRAYDSTTFNLISLIVGGLCTVVAAFVAARHAGQHFVRHGGWVAASSILFGVVLLAVLPAEPSQPIWVDLVAYVIIIPCGMLGGHLAGRIAEMPAEPPALD